MPTATPWSLRTIAVSLPLLLAACDLEHPGNSTPCTPGRQLPCACDGPIFGTQTCRPEGDGFDPCTCEAPTTTTDPETTTTLPPCDPAPTCGDAYLDPGEQCDDANTTPNDGCSPTCQLEPPHLIVGGTTTGHAELHYSHDAGTTWHPTTLPGNPLGTVTDLELGPTAAIAIVARQSIYRSLDDGATWTELAVPIVPRDDGLAFHSIRLLDDRWYLGGRGQIAVSDDDGTTWTLAHDDTEVLDQYARAVAYTTFARIGDDVIAGAGLSGPYYTIRSTDAGTTWSDGLFANGSNMPGSGADCTTLRILGEAGEFWAGASSICDNITYDPLDIWTNDSILPTSSWSQVTPGGMSPRFWGLGGDGSGTVMVLWGDANYDVDRVAVFPAGGGAPAVHPLPTSSATAGFDKVRFADDAWWIARGPIVGSEQASLLRSDDDGASWTALTEPPLDQVSSLAVR